jgi:hypothetical protein
MNFFIFLVFIVWILSTVLVRNIAIKRGADSFAWTVTGFSIGPFAIPFVLLCKKKKTPAKS